MLKDDPLDLYLTGENEEILDVAEVQEIQECLVSSLDHQRPPWSYKVEPLPANFDTATKPSLEVPPTLELKPLPSNLKYAFLAVGWTIADLKGISPLLYMHRIVTDPEVKPSRDTQRRLNPNMKEVVKKEVLKWLDAGIIYPISDSKWVSPTQTVPKKAGITVVETESGEKLTTLPVTGWRVCIDYRKLNNATSKDHFLLPFIDQIVEKLSGQKFYCFLDGTFAFRRMPFGLCNAPATFQRCMMSIFSDMVGESVEIFMDDFSIFDQSFESCLGQLERGVFPITFLYGTIKEEVYVCQPPGFEDPDYLDKVYKVFKALNGLYQALRAWYETLANYLLKDGFQRGKIDQTLFIKKQKGNILLVQVYVDGIIFRSTNKDLCKAFEKLIKDKFQMCSMGELTFFLGLQVKQKQDGIFISQDKYVAKILRKFGLTDEKSASTPIDTKKPLLKDPDGEDVDVDTYRLMIGSLMYLTSSSPDIMFVVYACARFQVTPKASHLHAVKRNFRLISWQCKKQTVVATSSTEAEYVAATSCCTQILWIQNQLLDYGEGFEQILDFFNASVIQYALMVNPTIYVSCINQFWSFVSLNKTNDVVRLQALIDRRKVLITEDMVRQALYLDDTDSIDCLHNEEIFAKLARMGYEKPSTKLTFYKAFFLVNWKFLIHTILQCMSAKKTSWNEFSSSMASAVICLATGRKFNFLKYMYPIFLQLMINAQVGDLSSHTTKYTSPALTQKVFANMRRVGKGFSGVDT
nr:DNA-directed DNA polymerase [Tanacetum cinerariifolium]